MVKFVYYFLPNSPFLIYLFLSFCIIPLEIIYSSIIDKLTVFFKQIIITINAIIFMYNPIRKSRLTENIKKYYNPVFDT